MSKNSDNNLFRARSTANLLCHGYFRLPHCRRHWHTLNWNAEHKGIDWRRPPSPQVVAEQVTRIFFPLITNRPCILANLPRTMHLPSWWFIRWLIFSSLCLKQSLLWQYIRLRRVKIKSREILYKAKRLIFFLNVTHTVTTLVWNLLLDYKINTTLSCIYLHVMLENLFSVRNFFYLKIWEGNFFQTHGHQICKCS